ncbi:hypothetical protein ACHQM5_007057 [Ranunculus cassubicifolius]
MGSVDTSDPRVAAEVLADLQRQASIAAGETAGSSAAVSRKGKEVVSSDVDLATLHKENAELKVALGKREKTIEFLQRQLKNAKDAIAELTSQNDELMKMTK